MRSSAGTSISSTDDHGAHAGAQGAPGSSDPALPGPVAEAPSAGRNAADGQDAGQDAVISEETLAYLRAETAAPSVVDESDGRPLIERLAEQLRTAADVLDTDTTDDSDDPNVIWLRDTEAVLAEFDRECLKPGYTGTRCPHTEGQCPHCGGAPGVMVGGCLYCCRDCGFPCAIEKDAEAFHADDYEESEDSTDLDGCPVSDPDCDAPNDGEWHCHDACEPPDVDHGGEA